MMLKLFVLSLSLFKFASAEVFTSVSDLKRVAKFQKHLIEAIPDGPMRSLNFYLQLSEQIECLFDDDGEVIIDPVSAIRMTALFSRVLNDTDSESPELRDLIIEEAESEGVILPEEQDVIGAVNALIRLQLVYNITVTAIGNGAFSSMHKKALPANCEQRLVPDAEDSALIAQEMATHQPHLRTMAIVWLRRAIKLSEKGGRVSLLDAARQHSKGNGIAKNLQELVKRADEDTNFDFAEAVKQFLVADEDSLLSAYQKPNAKIGFDLWAEHRRLCRESAFESYVPKRANSELKCAYSILGHHYFLIGPVKTEWVSVNPEVRVYYDVVSDSEIERVKNLAKSMLKRSVMYQADYSDKRVSKTAWLFQSNPDPAASDFIRRFNIRSNLLVNLNAEGTEAPQVLNYGLGGQYEPHFDYLPEPSKDYWVTNFGNRIGTLMFYLTDVEAGGSTIFTSLGIGIRPKKGSAIFWYNMMQSGEINNQSKHAGCPVIFGEKWVVNKWYHYWPQFDKRPCALLSDM